MRTLVAMAGLLGFVAGGQAESIPTGLADPTQPPFGGVAGTVGVARKPTGPVLQSTFVSASQRRAVISGRAYMVGDKFGDGVITDIQPYEVLVKQAGRESRLRLLPKLVKDTYLVKVPASRQEGGNSK